MLMEPKESSKEGKNKSAIAISFKWSGGRLRNGGLVGYLLPSERQARGYIDWVSAPQGRTLSEDNKIIELSGSQSVRRLEASLASRTVIIHHC